MFTNAKVLGATFVFVGVGAWEGERWKVEGGREKGEEEREEKERCVDDTRSTRCFFLFF